MKINKFIFFDIIILKSYTQNQPKMRKSERSQQKSQHHGSPGAVKFVVESAVKDDLRDTYSFVIQARYDEFSWKIHRNWKELTYLQHSFNDLRLKRTLSTFKVQIFVFVLLCLLLNFGIYFSFRANKTLKKFRFG